MNKDLSSVRAVIVGGGPAGLMAAERLAQVGVKVTIFDRMSSLGRKFLMAGRGGLNLTHSEPLDEFTWRYGAAALHVKPILEQFSPQELQEWCHGLGQKTFIGSSGRIFPDGLKASPLLRAWIRRLTDLGVTFALRQRWCGWNEQGALVFQNEKGEMASLKPDLTILALGGASWPRLGSDGAWVDAVRDRHIVVNPLRAANSGFIVPWSSYFAERFAGQPLKPILLSFGNATVQSEVMITQTGLEGGAIYTWSAHIRDTIEATGKADLYLDLRPGLSVEDLTDQLRRPRGSQSTASFLRKTGGLSAVAIGVLRESLKGEAIPTQSDALAALIKATKITLTRPSAIDRAISCAGGISFDELDDGLMLKKLPGVFAIGEMLDWEAPTGGYLIQASLSMGVVAARNAISYVRSKGL